MKQLSMHCLIWLLSCIVMIQFNFVSSMEKNFLGITAIALQGSAVYNLFPQSGVITKINAPQSYSSHLTFEPKIHFGMGQDSLSNLNVVYGQDGRLLYNDYPYAQYPINIVLGVTVLDKVIAKNGAWIKCEGTQQAPLAWKKTKGLMEGWESVSFKILDNSKATFNYNNFSYNCWVALENTACCTVHNTIFEKGFEVELNDSSRMQVKHIKTSSGQILVNSKDSASNLTLKDIEWSNAKRWAIANKAYNDKRLYCLCASKYDAECLWRHVPLELMVYIFSFVNNTYCFDRKKIWDNFVLKSSLSLKEQYETPPDFLKIEQVSSQYFATPIKLKNIVVPHLIISLSGFYSYAKVLDIAVHTLELKIENGAHIKISGYAKNIKIEGDQTTINRKNLWVKNDPYASTLSKFVGAIGSQEKLCNCS